MYSFGLQLCYDVSNNYLSFKLSPMMAIAYGAALLLMAVFALVSPVHADMAWVTFWPKVASNSHYFSDVPDGQPNTNDGFQKMLQADGTEVSWSRTDSMEAEGLTWWWIANIERDVVEKKYKAMEMVTVLQCALEARS